METKNNKTSWLHIRLSSNEKRIIQDLQLKTTCRNLSEYTRKVLLDQPVVTTYRNRSQDEMTGEMAVLNREMNAIGNNLNQAIKRLHTLQPNEEKSWAADIRLQAESLLSKIAQTKDLISIIAERWLR